MKIDCYVRVSKMCDSFLCYGEIIEGSKNKEYLFKLEERDLTRAILVSTEYLVETIPMGKTIQVYLQNDVGMNKIFSMELEKDKNRDILEKLQHQVITCQKRLYLIDCSKRKELKDKQHFIAKRMRDLKKKQVPNISRDDIPVYNQNPYAKKEISLYIRNNYRPIENTNKGVGILKYKEIEREVLGEGVGTNNTQGLINMAIEAISRLKTPCQIKLYTPANLGLSSYIEYGDSSNVGELGYLYNVIVSNKHSLKIIQSNERQKELQIKLKRLLSQK